MQLRFLRVELGGSLPSNIQEIVPSRLASLPARVLVERCVRREQGAWNEFLRRYGALIRGTIIQKLASFGHTDAKSDADDIFQEVFKGLIENDCRALSSIKNRDRIEPWLCAVALHKTIDFVRKKSPSPHSGETQSYVAEQSAQYSHSPPGESEAVEKVWEAVEELRPDEQLLVKWHYVHGLKYREMADLAEVSINTVSSRLFRIKKKLSRRISKKEIG